jgi:hypothetical protein
MVVAGLIAAGVGIAYLNRQSLAELAIPAGVGKVVRS